MQEGVGFALAVSPRAASREQQRRRLLDPQTTVDERQRQLHSPELGASDPLWNHEADTLQRQQPGVRQTANRRDSAREVIQAERAMMDHMAFRRLENNTQPRVREDDDATTRVVPRGRPRGNRTDETRPAAPLPEWPEAGTQDPFLKSNQVVKAMYDQIEQKERAVQRQNQRNRTVDGDGARPHLAAGVRREAWDRRCRDGMGRDSPNSIWENQRTVLHRKRAALIAEIAGIRSRRVNSEDLTEQEFLAENLQNAIEERDLLKLVVVVDTWRADVNGLLNGSVHPLDAVVKFDSESFGFHMTSFLLLRGARTFSGDQVKLQGMLHFAASSNARTEILRILVEDMGVDPDVTDEEGKTILWRSVKAYAGEKASLISQHSSDLDHRCPPRQATVLHLATERVSSKLVIDLLEKGASPLVADARGVTPLMSACEMHRFSVITPICESAKKNGHPVLLQQDADGKFALHYIAIHVGSPVSEQFNVIRYMLNNGNTFEDRCNEGMSILHYLCASAASRKLFADTFELKERPDLLRHVDIWGRTLLHTACIHMRRHKAQYVLAVCPELFHAKDTCGRKAIHAALCSSARDGDRASLVQHLLDYYVESAGACERSKLDIVNAPDGAGMTPLHLACFYGLRRAALVLLENGASIEATDSCGRRPIHLAVLNGVAETPMAYGNENETVTQVLSGEYNPEHVRARSSPGLSLMRALVGHGADTCAPDHARNLPLFVAASFGQVQASSWMIQVGASHGLFAM